MTKALSIETKGEVDILDITSEVSRIVKDSGANDGIVNVHIAGSTAAITTIEYEPGLKKDFPDFLERIAPKDIYYAHHETWGDYNGHSHVRASLLGPSLTVPFQGKKLILGTWQQIVLVELDTRPRSRRIYVTVLGS